MPDWHRLDAGTVKSSDLRQNTVLAHGVLLQSLGVLGGRLLSEQKKTWRTYVAKLNSVDWSRRNASLWEGRVMNGARMNGQKRAVFLGTNVLCNAVGLKLDERGRHAEESLEDMETA
jgi:DNA sulfur modification protein DndB